MPAQRCVTATSSPTNSWRNDSRDDWIAGVVSSTSVSSPRIETSRKPPSRTRPSGQLLPVVEPLPRIVRAVVENAIERLACDHLPPSRPDEVGKLRDETVPVAVGRNQDAIGLECLGILDPVVLAKLRTRRRRTRGQAANEARRLE